MRAFHPAMKPPPTLLESSPGAPSLPSPPLRLGDAVGAMMQRWAQVGNPKKPCRAMTQCPPWTRHCYLSERLGSSDERLMALEPFSRIMSRSRHGQGACHSARLPVQHGTLMPSDLTLVAFDAQTRAPFHAQNIDGTHPPPPPLLPLLPMFPSPPPAAAAARAIIVRSCFKSFLHGTPMSIEGNVAQKIAPVRPYSTWTDVPTDFNATQSAGKASPGRKKGRKYGKNRRRYKDSTRNLVAWGSCLPRCYVTISHLVKGLLRPVGTKIRVETGNKRPVIAGSPERAPAGPVVGVCMINLTPANVE